MTRHWTMRHPESRATPSMSLEERLARKAEVTRGGCWLYKGATNQSGYGLLYWDGRLRVVHRVSYESIVGPVPAGLSLDHLCRVRSCFNPAHLEPVTQAENLRRGRAARAAERVA